MHEKKGKKEFNPSSRLILKIWEILEINFQILMGS